MTCKLNLKYFVVLPLNTPPPPKTKKKRNLNLVFFWERERENQHQLLPSNKVLGEKKWSFSHAPMQLIRSQLATCDFFFGHVLFMCRVEYIGALDTSQMRERERERERGIKEGKK